MPDQQGAVLYVDTSALVKLLVREPESDAVESELARWPGLATSSLTSVELSRAMLRARDQQRDNPGPETTPEELLKTLAEIPITSRVLIVANTIEPVVLRTLDAIHLASALALGPDLGGVMTYDARLADAAREHGIAVHAPA